MRLIIALIALVVILVVGVPQVFYTVDQTQYVVITRFGEVQGVEREPGLKIKAPFVDQVNVIDKR